jgi:hypothetical protein
MAFVRFGLCQPIRRQLVVHACNSPSIPVDRQPFERKLAPSSRTPPLYVE